MSWSGAKHRPMRFRSTSTGTPCPAAPACSSPSSAAPMARRSRPARSSFAMTRQTAASRPGISSIACPSPRRATAPSCGPPSRPVAHAKAPAARFSTSWARRAAARPAARPPPSRARSPPSRARPTSSRPASRLMIRRTRTERGRCIACSSARPTASRIGGSPTAGSITGGFSTSIRWRGCASRTPALSRGFTPAWRRSSRAAS